MVKSAILSVVFALALMPFGLNATDIKKDMDPVKNSPNNPRMPQSDYVTMYVYTGEDILTFDFSESIQSLIVTLTDESTGEIQTGSVTRQEPSMPAFLPDYGSFSVTCEADNGSMFYTQFSF